MLQFNPILVLHPTDDVPDNGWRDRAADLTRNALGIITELTNRQGWTSDPTLVHVMYDAQRTLLREHAKLRVFNEAEEIQIFWVVDGGTDPDLPASGGGGSAAGWGSGDGTTGFCTMHASMLDKPDDPINVYLLVHELLHTLGLPHPPEGPLSIPCKYYRIMCYSGWNFSMWYNDRNTRGLQSYGLSPEEVEHIQSLVTLEEAKVLTALTRMEIMEFATEAFGNLGSVAVATITAIALAESGGAYWAVGDNHTALNPVTGKPWQTADSVYRYDYGLNQINSAWFFDSQKLISDPAYNMEKARVVYDVQGFEAWVTYTGGHYLKHYEEPDDATQDIPVSAMSPELTHEQAMFLVTDAYYGGYLANVDSSFKPVLKRTSEAGNVYQGWLLERRETQQFQT